MTAPRPGNPQTETRDPGGHGMIAFRPWRAG